MFFCLENNWLCYLSTKEFGKECHQSRDTKIEISDEVLIQSHPIFLLCMYGRGICVVDNG